MLEEELERRAHQLLYNQLQDIIRTFEGFKLSGAHPDTKAVNERANTLAISLADSLINEGNLVRHARRELHILGEDPDTTAHYLSMIRIFAEMGHSGGSAAYFVPTLERLLRFENLKPLTNDPIEWEEVGHGMWQNTRNSRMFSKDGGKTFYDVKNPDVPLSYKDQE